MLGRPQTPDILVTGTPDGILSGEFPTASQIVRTLHPDTINLGNVSRVIHCP